MNSSLRRLCFLGTLLLVFAALPLAAQTTGTFGANDSYVDMYAKQVIALVTKDAGLFVPTGQILFFFAATGKLLGLLRKEFLRIATNRHGVFLDINAIVWWLVMVVFGSLVLQFWPDFAQVIPTVFANLARQIDHAIVKQFYDTLKDAFHNTPMPYWTDVVFSLIYFLVLISLIAMSAVVFIIESFAYTGIAIFTICTPLVVWSFMTETQTRRFWNMIDNIVVFSSYKLVANISLFLYCSFILNFFTNTFHGVYTMGQWMYLLIPTMTFALGMIFFMLNIPKIAGMVFGGTSVGSMGEATFSSAKGLVSQGVRFAMANM